MNFIYLSSSFNSFQHFDNIVLSHHRFPRLTLLEYFKINPQHMSLKENIFNILFLQLKLPQSLKYLSDTICLENLLKYLTAFPCGWKIVLLMDDFYLSVYKSGWQRN